MTLRASSPSYGLGALLSYKGIAEGVENSNFHVRTYPGELHPDDLREARLRLRICRSFVGLMEHLLGRFNGLNCPTPIRARETRGPSPAFQRPSGS